MEQFSGREEELIKTLSTMAKQVKTKGGGEGPTEPGDRSHSLSDSYRSGSMDGEGEVFNDEDYYNEPYTPNGEEEYYNGSFDLDDDEEYPDDQFHDEGGSYGSGSYGSDYS